MTEPLTPEALVEALVTCLEENDHRSRYQQALALLSGPLVPIITDAAETRAAHQQVAAERDEARAEYERGLEHRNDLMDRVVDLKTSLAAAKSREDAANAELARLQAEGEAKDRALKPFADYADFAERHEWPKDIAEDPTTPVLGRAGWDGEIACEVTVGDFQAARAATAREG